MQILDIKETRSGFSFFHLRPEKIALPAIAFDKELLLRSTLAQTVINYNKDEISFADLLFEIYPDLSLTELALVMEDLHKLKLDYFAAVLAKYNLGYNENLVLVLQALLRQPPKFKLWSHERRLAPRDLAALRLPLGESFHPILEKIAALQCTRQVGAQILELAAEIFLMGNSLTGILDSATSGEKWLGELKRIRYPQTTTNDTQMHRKIKELPWPSHIEAEWQRRGDQTGLQIKFFAPSETELTRRLEGIKNIKNIWTN